MQKSLRIRVDILESAVAELNELPGQMKALSSQFLLLRQEVGDRITALRGDMRAMRGELGAEMDAMRVELRGEMGTMRDGLRAEMAAMRTELTEAIHDGDERVLSQMRTLHEDLVDRITRLGEGHGPSGSKAPRPDPQRARKRR
jgi:hypothetical protein